MKKTEKIEVRVSAEEKERLNELADARNQNISELIRDRMAGNYTMPAQSFSRDIIWNRGISVLALVLGLMAFIWSMIALMDGRSNTLPPTMSSVRMTPPDTVFAVLETKVAHRNGFTQSYTIKVDDATYRTTHLIREEGGVYRLTADLCRVQSDTCLELETKELILSEPSTYSRQSTAIFFENNQPVFQLSAFPQALPRAAKGES